MIGSISAATSSALFGFALERSDRTMKAAVSDAATTCGRRLARV
ncbi:MAG TPA: hypothetical protein VEL10_06370 [Gaiellaceae bacterium]|nr:hypothetical protein [Gaiellaceae bacterium]